MKTLFIALVSLGALSGCAVYDAPYAYDGNPYSYNGGAPYYYGGAPYYSPAYVGPPVSLSFDFGYFHGFGGRGGGHRGRGFGRGH